MKKHFTLLVIFMAIVMGTKADDMTSTPLTFEAVEAGTITVNWEQYSSPSLDAIQYKLNSGEWTDVTWGTDIVLAANDVICFRGDNGTCYDESIWAGFHIECSNNCYVYGNMMSLIDKDGYATNTTLTETYTFWRLFQKSDNTPNTTIRNHPTKDIVLPATTLTINCYDGLFADCQGLTRAPALPATVLAEWCYGEMFNGCTSLTTAPDLPATTLVEGCYTMMFSGCTNLNYVKCLATDISADYCTTNWLDGVAATGTFVKATSMDDWTVGSDGIPSDWTAKNATETITVNSDGAGNYWATYYNHTDGYIADANTTVYTAKVSSDKSKVELTVVDDKTIPVGNAVVLKSSSETVTLTYDIAATGTLTDNELQASPTAITTPANTYMLTKGTSGVGFYHWTGTNIPANRGYLTISGATSREFFSIDDGVITGVNEIEDVRWQKDDVYYDLKGRRVLHPTKGVYVKNGKKIIFK